MMHPLDDYEAKRRKRRTGSGVQVVTDATTESNLVIVDRDNKIEKEAPKYVR
jgi:hypothetical protein